MAEPAVRGRSLVECACHEARCSAAVRTLAAGALDRPRVRLGTRHRDSRVLVVCSQPPELCFRPLCSGACQCSRAWH